MVPSPRFRAFHAEPLAAALRRVALPYPYTRSVNHTVRVQRLVSVQGYASHKSGPLRWLKGLCASKGSLGAAGLQKQRRIGNQWSCQTTRIAGRAEREWDGGPAGIPGSHGRQNVLGSA